MDTAVIYCRKSNASAQANDVSFDDQEICCREYAEKMGYSVYKVYRESHSGADLKHRPMIWEAIDDIQQKHAQVLLVRNFDRLARNTEHAGVIRYEVKEKAKGRVEAALDPNEETMVTKLLDLVGEAERENTAARLERGKFRRAKRGELTGSCNPLFGYGWEDDEPGRRTCYRIDPETGPIVERIFKLVLSGKSLRGIARLLNVEGVPTPAMVAAQREQLGRRQVGSIWHQEQIRRIIVDTTYTGQKSLFRYETWTADNGKRQCKHREDTSQILTMDVPALIDQATFDAAQSIVVSKSRSGRPPLDIEATWLRGHVHCGCCGGRMQVSQGYRDGRYVYRCKRRPSTAASPEEMCPGGEVSIRTRVLDGHGYDALVRVLTHIDEVGEMMLARSGVSKTQVLVSMAEGFQAQLKAKREELERTLRRSRQIEDDDLAKDYLRAAKELNAEIHRLELEYAEAREGLDARNAGNTQVATFIERMRQSLRDGVLPTVEGIKDLPLDDRRYMLEASGITLFVYPKHYREDGRRVILAAAMPWDTGIDPALVRRFEERMGAELVGKIKSAQEIAAQIHTEAGGSGVTEVTLDALVEKLSRTSSHSSLH